MNRRLSRAVASLIALSAAVGIGAGEAVILRNDRFAIPAQVADELHVERPVPAADGAARVKATATRIAGGRAAVRGTARDLLASGTATRADPVLYLYGRVGDPRARAIATRQILIAAAAGQDVAVLARDHGLRLREAITERPGWWIAEPVAGGDAFAALDAAGTLGADRRAAIAWPLLHMPVSQRYDPNDPMYQGDGIPPPGNVPPGYLWHLEDTNRGIRVREVWNTWRGEGINIAISDTGIQSDHPELSPNARGQFSRDYFFNDADPRPSSADDNHGTAVAGLALAAGDNGIGMAGTAFHAGLIASKVLNDFDPNAYDASGLATDSGMRAAMRVQATASNSSDLCHVNSNSWGVPDDGAQVGGPGPLMLLGMQEALANGRRGFGTVFVFAAGNGGKPNPNSIVPDGIQDCTAFDGYLNRFVIGVAAWRSEIPAPFYNKASYSESGPNISISAPGGDSNRGIVTLDRTGDDGYIVDDPLPLPPPSDFNGDSVVVTTPTNQDPPIFVMPGGIFDVHPPALPFENGDYIPQSYPMMGTSFAAPIVAGAAALMVQARGQLSWRDVRQIMWHRGQNKLPPPWPPNATTHDPWGHWRANTAGLLYNNWYGFGAVDVGRFIFGGDGSEANMDAAGSRDEPGARRWPLLPPLTTYPVVYQETIPLPTVPPDRAAIYDAPENPPNQDLVPNGRPVVGIGNRICAIPLDFTNPALCATPAPDRFRVEAVELSITLRDVGITSYPVGFDPVGAAAGFDWGDYQFFLQSPGGSLCYIGRQRPGGAIPEGGSWEWTFTELFHANEDYVNGTWFLLILDERNNVPPDFIRDMGNGNPPQARVEKVGMKVYGHQAYAQPSLSSLSRPAVPSGSGDQTIELTGSGFALSQGRLGVSTAYWDPDGIAGPAVPVELPTSYLADNRVRVTIPGGVIPTATPGQAYITVANPAIVVGRAGGIDAFDTPNVILPTNTPAGTDRRMKRCPDAEEKPIRYSRPPVVGPIADIRLSSGGSFSFSVSVTDPDAEAGLPIGTPETVSVSLVSFNPYFVAPASFVIGGPVGPFAGVGSGTYTITGSTTGSNSGFAYIELRATDGVVTTIRPFRVVIPSDEDGSGCGGGMGLALLGVPLGVWLIRRRRRSA